MVHCPRAGLPPTPRHLSAWKEAGVLQRCSQLRGRLSPQLRGTCTEARRPGDRSPPARSSLQALGSRRWRRRVQETPHWPVGGGTGTAGTAGGTEQQLWVLTRVSPQSRHVQPAAQPKFSKQDEVWFFF